MERDRKPVWSKWRLVPEWALWEAVALSMNIDPDAVRRKAWNSSLHPGELTESKEFKRRAEILYRIVGTGKPERSSLKLQSESGAELAATILPTDFVKWVETQVPDWKPLPLELYEIAGRECTPMQTSKWPWGDYETPLLGVLVEVAAEFYPKRDIKPPKQAAIAKWLKTKYPKMSDRDIAAIDKLLRSQGD